MIRPYTVFAPRYAPIGIGAGHHSRFTSPSPHLCPVIHDVLIQGRGVAGAVLAEACRVRGLSVHVFDRKQPGNATLAAGGAVNPVVLRRDGLCWGAAFLMPVAHAFYTEWDRRMGVHTWHEASVVKLFADEKDAAHWKKAMNNPELLPFLAQHPEPEIDQGPFHAPFGYGTVTNAGWSDIPELLAAQRRQLLDDGALSERLVEETEVRQEAGLVRIGEVSGRWLVDCTGAFSSQAGLVPVKGETLRVRIPGLRLTRIVYGGVGLVPAGGDVFQVGSTFKWTDIWEGPTEEARNWMLARVAGMVKLPVELLEARAGVRPAARDRKPILGMVGPRKAVFNGLGARGVMQAPWCAQHLLDHLFDGKPLGAEVDVARFSA